MDTWEYDLRATEGKPQDFVRDLNRLGEKGWEVVGPVSLNMSTRNVTGQAGFLLLKRRRSR